MRNPPIATFCVVVTAAAAAWLAIDLTGQLAPPPTPSAIVGSGFAADEGPNRILHLSGEPYAIGLRRAELLVDLIAPGQGSAAAASCRSATELDRRLRAAERLELLGASHGLRQGAAAEARGGDYRSALADQAGCAYGRAAGVLLAVGGDRGIDGLALIGHSLEIPESAPTVAAPVVTAVTPSSGYGFVAVSPPGLIGVTTGINLHGLAIAVQPTGATLAGGMPPPILARRVLEQARNVEEALPILTDAEPVGPWLAALADRTGAAVLLRLGERARRQVTAGLVGAAEADDRNAEVDLGERRFSPPVQRQERLDQMLAAVTAEEKITPDDLLGFLRDRRAAGGHALPLGHPHAIDGLRAAQVVMVDAVGGRLWLATGPFGLGELLAYDVAGLLAAQRPADLVSARRPASDGAADPLRGFAAQVQEARLAWSEARAALAAGELAAAEAHLVRTTALSDHPTTLHLRGRLARARGERRWALDFFSQALRAPAGDTAQAARLRADMAQP